MSAMFGLCLCASAIMRRASADESEAGRTCCVCTYNGERCGVGARVGVAAGLIVEAAGLIGVLILVYDCGRRNAGLIERADIGDSARDLGCESAMMSTEIGEAGREVGCAAAESS